MRQTLRGVLFAFCLGSVAGCGGGPSYSKQMKVVLKDFNDLIELCKGIKQPPHLESQEGTIRRLCKKLNDDYAALVTMEQGMDARAKKRIERKYELVKWSIRKTLEGQETRLTSLPKGKELIAEAMGDHLPFPLPKSPEQTP